MALGSLFGGSSASAPSAPLSTSTSSASSQQLKEKLQNQITQELAVVNATELVNKLTENCFAKCIQQPAASLTSVDDLCVNQCSEKYMRAWNVISKAYITRIQQASSSGELI
ncbi:hypothetical protein PACTADRAFT_46384 [Pachysolen tannophilus NRRL Y-2460]|uniref:Mitochondrial import inner membrane translocase subunit n=1 Tax=Pachysolen tannophilus NRRL Y-2460 TaxID=669874 RepID=A0A1E4TMQ6_PACTA|nr:hypothetical protein PACTADRAFT_52198 [Pachysolen tannophilus NRRL Y-2460]ODV93241.1 hypothetical protein PACTADRAFT_46384 [Pachysolen tannophilus NRRL Y-2460]